MRELASRVTLRLNLYGRLSLSDTANVVVAVYRTPRTLGSVRKASTIRRLRRYEGDKAQESEEIGRAHV